MRVSAGFDVSAETVFATSKPTLQLRESGEANADITLGSTNVRLMHAFDCSPIFGSGEYVTVASDLQAALNALGGSYQTYTVTLDPATHRYTVAGSGTAFSLRFDQTTGGPFLKDILGFASDDTGSATTHTGTLRPKYLIVPAVGGLAEVTEGSEREASVVGQQNDQGVGLIQPPPTVAMEESFRVQFEKKNQTFKDWAAAGVWTWEDFFKHCRGRYPFAIETGPQDEVSVHRLRGQHAFFRLGDTVIRVTRDFDNQFDVVLRTVLKGFLA